MSVEQGKKLRNSKIIESVIETPLASPSRTAGTNSVDHDSSENNDVSSQLAEISENYERKKTSSSQNLVD